MSYQSKNLSVLAYANGFTLWHYTTADAHSAVDGEGYFNAAADMLRVGDIIVANVATGSTMQAGMFLVTSNAAGVVDVGDMTQVSQTDTD